MNPRIMPCALLLVAGLSLFGCRPSSDSTKPGADSDPSTSGLLTGAIESSGPVALELNWRLGRRCVYGMQANQNSQTQIPQRRDVVNQRATLAQQYVIHVVGDRGSSGKELELEYLMTDMNLTDNQRTVFSFRSSETNATAGASDPMTALLRDMSALRLKFSVDANDRVTAMAGLDEFLRKVGQSAPLRSRSVLTNMFGADHFKRMVELGVGLPDRPVQPGDTWPVSREIVLGPMGNILVNLTYTFAEWQRRQDKPCAKLMFQGTLQSVGGESQGPLGIKTQLKGGTLFGHTLFDPGAGVILESHTDQSMSVEAAAPLPSLNPETPGGTVTINTDLRQTIDLQLVEWTDP